MIAPLSLVCIVEDDASVRRALGRLVSTFGYEVKLFASGRQFLDGPSAEDAACLIIDVSMPGMDGFELHTLLKAEGNITPTIFMSAHDVVALRERAQKAGCVSFLNKPCDEKLLLDALNKAVATA